MRTRATIALLFAVVTVPVSAQKPDGPGPCGPSQPEVQQELADFLSAPDLAGVRQRMGLAGALPSELTQLGTTPAESSACARLRAALPSALRVTGASAPSTAAFFRVGNMFLVAVRARPINAKNPTAPGPDQTLSFTEAFEYMGGYAVR